MRANPPGYLFYIVGGAIVALILVFGIVRSLRRSKSAARAASRVVPDPSGLVEGAELAPEGVGDSASPAPVADPGPRRMTDDRT